MYSLCVFSFGIFISSQLVSVNRYHNEFVGSENVVHIEEAGKKQSLSLCCGLFDMDEDNYKQEFKTQVQKFISSYKDTPNIEIELRVGIRKQGSFVSGVSGPQFETIRKRLDTLAGEPTISDTTDYSTEDHKRITFNTDNLEKSITAIKKTRLEVTELRLETSKWYVRLSAATEEKLHRGSDFSDEHVRANPDFYTCRRKVCICALNRIY